jgi:predicted dehydrogenase
MKRPPIRVAIIGLGGFAGTHHRALLNLENRGEARVVCACDPQAERFTAERNEWRFVERGVRVFEDYRRMLETCGRELDMLVVPTPIPLHAEMHRAGAELGLGVYLEKPPTLDHRELEEMIRVDQAAPHAAFVGFNFIIEPGRMELKQRLLDGEFGALRETRLLGRWPRPTSYFQRNRWAGRLRGGDGRVILDSVIGNAMAHYVHNVLCWAGPGGLLTWAEPAEVQARLFRAYPIEGADTFFVTLHTTNGITQRFAQTHTRTPTMVHRESVHCDDAAFHYQVGLGGEIRWRDGRVERLTSPHFETLEENHRAYFAYLRRESPRPATRLVDCRPFVLLNNLAHISAGEIHNFSPECVASYWNEREQKDYLEIAGLAQAQEAFLAEGIWPAHLGGPAGPPPLATPRDLGRFQATIEAMFAARPPEPSGG